MLRVVVVVAVFIAGGLWTTTVPRALAQPSQADVSAERSYNALGADDRIRLQVMLIAAGHLNAVPNVTFNGRTLAAIHEFQRSQGQAESGILDAAQLEVLERNARRMLNLWRFEKVPHPITGHSLWVPSGIGLEQERDSEGITWRRKEVAVIKFIALPSGDISRGHSAELEALRRRGHAIDYEVRRDDFFAIATSDPARGIKHYERYQKVGAGLVGFEAFWSIANDTTYQFERIAALMSASLRSSATGAPFIDPPRVPDTYGDTPAKPDGEEAVPRASSGTGMFVSRNGHILTNSHVVDGCSAIRVTTSGGDTVDAVVSARDARNDLALVRTTLKPSRVAMFRRSGVRLGEDVVAFGFPFADVLASGGSFTQGNVSATAGLGDDSRYMQISTPIQPGNSGGPVLDAAGNVVGVVTAKMDELKVLVATRNLPQNVNFALKEAMVRNFLESRNVSIEDSQGASALARPELADRAKEISVLIRCDGEAAASGN